MNIKLDENLSISHVTLLKNIGHNAERVYDEGMSGWSDSKIWEAICKENKFFITLDLDFSDIRKFKPGTHPGILLIRSDNKGIKPVKKILHKVISEASLENFKGCLVVADKNKTRIRKK